jgi:hypothetical protein
MKHVAFGGRLVMLGFGSIMPLADYLACLRAINGFFV